MRTRTHSLTRTQADCLQAIWARGDVLMTRSAPPPPPTRSVGKFTLISYGDILPFSRQTIFSLVSLHLLKLTAHDMRRLIPTISGARLAAKLPVWTPRPSALENDENEEESKP